MINCCQVEKINVWKNTKQISNRYFKPGDKFFFRLYISHKEMSKDGVIISRLGKTTYIGDIKDMLIN